MDGSDVDLKAVLKARSRVHDVVVVPQDVPPDWFGIAFGGVVYAGSYPFAHDPATGQHVLVKNDDRVMFRVDAASPPALYDAVRRHVECRTT